MNEIALLIAFLAGHTFNTDCVQTQDNGKSGYAVDSLSFTGGGKTDENELLYSLTRRMYADSQCAGEVAFEKAQGGRVKFGPDSETFFWPAPGEKRFDAEWSSEAGKTKGSIGIQREKNEVRYSLSSHMLQMISFKLSK
jgi:hypothetical protein